MNPIQKKLDALVKDIGDRHVPWPFSRMKWELLAEWARLMVISVAVDHAVSDLDTESDHEPLSSAREGALAESMYRGAELYYKIETRLREIEAELEEEK